jgi:hypothetical protein
VDPNIVMTAIIFLSLCLGIGIAWAGPWIVGKVMERTPLW